MKKILFPALLITIVIFQACTGKGPQEPVYKVGTDSVKTALLEQDSHNISYWASKKAKGRILVRLSSIEGLVPLKKDTLESVKALVDKGDYDALLAAGDSNYKFGLFSSDNTAYLAYNLGIANEVYWVVPLFSSITETDLAGFKEYLKNKMPQQAGEIDALKLSGQMVNGVISGVPVKIVALEDLPVMDKPVILEMDNTFLAGMYQDEKRTRVLQFISGFFAKLKEAGISSDMVSISASTENGLVPLKYRFMAKYLSEILSNPDMVNGPPPALWKERAEALKIEQKSIKDAVPVYRKITTDYPQDADSHYDLSRAYFELGKLDACKDELASAVKLDPGYSRAYSDYATQLFSKGDKAQADSFASLLK